ncbi:helix-turn-helix domain-containing protein [Hymenobacter sp. 102]|uniref:helix-turn-helix domain-containing protein n=1 Tax=Hymenobacter sp. 102 TaxID=3403152 RepID=UPI003CEEDB43
MNTPLFHLAQQLRAYRHRKHLSQQQMADTLQVKRPSYAAYEEKRAAPPYPVLFRIARLLETTLDALLGYDPAVDLAAEKCPTAPLVTAAPVHFRMRRHPEPAVPAPSSNRPFVTWP